MKDFSSSRDILNVAMFSYEIYLDHSDIFVCEQKERSDFAARSSACFVFVVGATPIARLSIINDAIIDPANAGIMRLGIMHKIMNIVA